MNKGQRPTPSSQSERCPTTLDVIKYFGSKLRSRSSRLEDADGIGRGALDEFRELAHGHRRLEVLLLDVVSQRVANRLPYGQVGRVTKRQEDNIVAETDNAPTHPHHRLEPMVRDGGRSDSQAAAQLS